MIVDALCRLIFTAEDAEKQGTEDKEEASCWLAPEELTDWSEIGGEGDGEKVSREP